MKKLILLAVVVFGFAATSFAQHVSGPAQIAANVNPPAAISPNLAIAVDNGMDFGVLTNVKNGGTVRLTPASVLSSTNNVGFVANTGLAAQFTITNANILPQITIPTFYFPFAGGKLDIVQATDCTMTPNVYTNANLYVVHIGGTITLYDGATGAFAINGLTISVNNE